VKNTPIGTVFKRDGSYWKVTGKPRMAILLESYPAIRCTKTGKEFKQTNFFSCTFVDRLPWEPGVKFKPAPAGKVSITGRERGDIKRAITYLKGQIARDQKRLADYEEKLKNV
jgi:hypothetical protein